MKQGEIWLINLDPTIGAELKKTRPAIIVNIDSIGKLPLKIIVPLTDWKEKFEMAPWMIKIEPNPENNLGKNSAADCFQIRSISDKRFVKKIGKINNENIEKVKDGLVQVLSIAT